MKKAPRTMAVVAVSLLALVGCSYSPADAAVVDGIRVTDAEVQATAPVLAPLLQTPSNAAPIVVQSEVQGVIAERLGAAKGIPLTDAARQPVIAADPALTTLAKDPASAAFAARLANLQIVVQAVGDQELLTACNAAQVEMNPRYGAWSPDQCAITVDLGGLSRPAPTSAATQG